MNRIALRSDTFSLRAALVTVLLAGLSLPLGCKDEEPCDDGQVSVGTGCFAKETGGTGGVPSPPEAGAGGGGEPAGNPDATFRTRCETDDDCGDAPVCATDPLFYCTQLECLEDEANAGVCPSDWQCVKLNEETPSACVDVNGF